MYSMSAFIELHQQGNVTSQDLHNWYHFLFLYFNINCKTN